MNKGLGNLMMGFEGQVTDVRISCPFFSDAIFCSPASLWLPGLNGRIKSVRHTALFHRAPLARHHRHSLSCILVHRQRLNACNNTIRSEKTEAVRAGDIHGPMILQHHLVILNVIDHKIMVLAHQDCGAELLGPFILQ